MGSITEATILHHMCIVLLFLWFLNYFHYCHPVAYFLSIVYLYFVHEGYVTKLIKKLQFQERRDSNQRRVLLDSESVRWLNHAIEKMWLVSMEEIVSQKILLPMVPWFLKKYKPWTVKEVELQHLYLGRSPPIFTEMRVLQQSTGDDHLVLELGMNFRTADDMSAILGAKLTKRLGFGMRVKMHLLGMHVEGKVLVGVKFLPKWPFIGRLRVCFAGPPYFQMTVKPIFNHGLDVTELPGIAGWIDNLLGLVFEETLVEPNMLVVDFEKFVSPQPEKWFTVDAKEPIAHAIVEVIEGVDMKPSDMNGLADPYVKGQLGPYRFRTKTQKKTLAPKWREEFKIPICNWESQSMLVIEARDKDRVFDETLGDCCVDINELRDGQRHDLWLPLQNIKTGRLHLAITIFKGDGKRAKPSCEADTTESDSKTISSPADSVKKGSYTSRSSEKPGTISDKFEPIDFEGQVETGVWIHRPGSEVAQVWEPRKGKSRHLNSHSRDSQVLGEVADVSRSLKSISTNSCKNDGSSDDEIADAIKPLSNNPVRKGFRKIKSVLRKSPKVGEKPISLEHHVPSPRENIRELHTKEVGVRLIVDTIVAPPSLKNSKDDEEELLEGSTGEKTQIGHGKGKTKRIFKHAGKSASGLKVRLSRKAMKKSKAEPGMSLNDKNVPFNMNSSEDDSLASSMDVSLAETGLVIPGSSGSATLSHNNSFRSTGNQIQTGGRSGNGSFRSEDRAVETPKNGSVQTPKKRSMHSPTHHDDNGTPMHPR